MVNLGQFGKALDKAKALAGQHGDKIDSAIDKSVGAVDKATGGKHHDKIAESGAKLKGAAERLTGSADAGEETLRDRDPATGAPPAPAQDAPVADPGAAGTAADGPVADPNAPKDAS